MNSVNRALFNELRKIIPSIPDNATRIELIIEIGASPKVKVDYLVRESGETETEFKVFEITEIKP